MESAKIYDVDIGSIMKKEKEREKREADEKGGDKARRG